MIVHHWRSILYSPQWLSTIDRSGPSTVGSPNFEGADVDGLLLTDSQLLTVQIQLMTINNRQSNVNGFELSRVGNPNFEDADVHSLLLINSQLLRGSQLLTVHIWLMIINYWHPNVYGFGSSRVGSPNFEDADVDSPLLTQSTFDLRLSTIDSHMLMSLDHQGLIV